MVSCQPLSGLFEEVERRGVHPSEFTRNVDRSFDYLSNRRNRIHWDEFRTILERLSDYYSDEEIVDIGRCLVRTKAQRPFGLIAKRFLTVGGFYAAVFSSKSGWGRPMFPCMDSTFAQLDDDLFELSLTMHDGFPLSRPFMLITEGNIIGMAEWLGSGPPVVTVEPIERGARFDVQASDSSSRVGRLRQRLMLPLRANAMATELYEAHSSLRSRYDALQEALVERERTTEELRQSQARLSLALESVEMTLWDWDLRDDVVTIDGIGREVVPRDDSERALGLRFFLQFVVEEDRSRVAEAARSAFETANPFAQQFRVIRGGETRVLEARGQVFRDRSGEPVRFSGVANDITDELLRSERDTRLVQMINGSPLEIFVVEPETLRILETNQVARNHLGYSEDELRALPLDAIVAAEDETAASAFESIVEGETDLAFDVVRHRRKDGSTYPIELRVQRSSLNSRPVLIAIALDVTDRVTAEQRQRDLEAQLWKVQKLDALGTLASGVAHDFNNLLMAIGISTEIAASQIESDSPAAEQLARIVRATEHGRVLARQILAFSSEGGRPQTPTELGPVVTDAIELLVAALPATIRLRTDVAVSDCVVLTEGSQIGQVVTNLCTNAAQATRGMMGTVDVQLAPYALESAEAAQFPSLVPGPHVELRVADTGVGMTSDVVERIFDPFFSTKGLDGGTGLGLAVVHGIVQAHGGAIDVQSEDGVGTTMRVLLPSADRVEVVEPTIDLRPTRRAGRILVVDDVGVIAEALNLGLEEMGYEVDAFSSSTDAADAFAFDPSSFDLVVTDQTMPGMSGLQLAERIRALRPELPIVLISGLGTPFGDDEEMRLSGISEVLAKPFSLQVLGDTVARLLDKEPVARPVSGN